jgi:hypothetical protein
LAAIEDRLSTVEALAMLERPAGAKIDRVDGVWQVRPADSRATGASLREYFHLKSSAKIDIDLVVESSGVGQHLYWVRVYGWMRF